MNVPTTGTAHPPPSVGHTLPPSPTKMGHVIPTAGSIKKMLPFAAFLMAFATVMTPLLIYMDNTGKSNIYVYAFLSINF